MEFRLSIGASFLLAILASVSTSAEAKPPSWGVTKDPQTQGDLRYCELSYKFGAQSVEGVDQILGFQSYKTHGDHVLFRHWNVSFFNTPRGLDFYYPEDPQNAGTKKFVAVLSPTGTSFLMMGKVDPVQSARLFDAFTSRDGSGADITLEVSGTKVQVPTKHSKIMIQTFNACRAKL